MSTPPERTELLDRERRWMRPAGIASILGAIAIQAGFIVNGSALEGEGTAERLLEASRGNADAQLLLGLFIAAAGFALLAIPITFFFAAARARSERVLRQLVGLGIAGALMMGGGLVANHFSYLDAADTFAAAEAERAEPAPEESQPEAEDPEEAEDEADERARDATREASGATLSGVLIRGGALAFAIGFFYTSLWSMRTGLLTRFWGSLGMASAVVLALFFLYFFTLIWFLAMGFLLLGAWPGGRPPAWEEGRAIPWPKPGEDPGEATEDEVEGTGRQVTERPLPEGETGEQSQGTAGPAPGPPPKKRKRRG